MGQYHYVANLDKREFLHPHTLGDGLKLMEFGASAEGTMTGLALLLAVSNGRGGGDYHEPELGTERSDGGVVVDKDIQLIHAVIGRWGGDRIAIIGDYADDDDFSGFVADDPLLNPWTEKEETLGPVWEDISLSVRRVLELDLYCQPGRTWNSPTGDPYSILDSQQTEKGVTA